MFIHKSVVHLDVRTAFLIAIKPLFHTCLTNILQQLGSQRCTCTSNALFKRWKISRPCFIGFWLDVTSQEKSHGVKSNESGAYSIGRGLPIYRSGSYSYNQAACLTNIWHHWCVRVSNAFFKRWVIPRPCSIDFWPDAAPQKKIRWTWNPFNSMKAHPPMQERTNLTRMMRWTAILLKMTRCMWATAESSPTQDSWSIRECPSRSRKNGPIKPSEETAHQTNDFGVSRSCSWLCAGLVSPLKRVLCWLEQSERWKRASSLNHICSRIEGSFWK